ncbi:MAG TPA: N-acetylmuramoyl-L-alanine amidase, partial [Methylophilus sp.]
MQITTQPIEIDAEGIASPCQFVASPNFDARPENTVVDMVVIHNISLPPGQYGGEGVLQLFTNQLDPTAHPYYAQIAHLKVSSHFFIRRCGSLIQCVPCQQRA